MSVVGSDSVRMGASGSASYGIDQSIRFNDDGAAYMSRTSTTATSSTIFTISLWFKRGNLTTAGQSPTLINEYSGNSDAAYLIMRLQPADTINVSGYTTNWRTTTRVFRDPSAWYHFVLAVDTNQATAADRIKLYINGVEETSFSASSNPSSGTNLGFNTGGAQNIGRINPTIGGTNYFDGYMAEFNFIDGQQLSPTSFGETNDDGVWIAKAYAGSYGDNGFYLTGEDSADLGADESGNSNDFTSSGLTSDDQVTDTPTENYATWNVLDKGTITASDGNLTVTSGADQAGIRSTIAIPQSGKYYWEVTCNTLGYINQIGLASSSKSMANINDSGATVSNRGWGFGSWFSSFNGNVTKFKSDVGGGGSGANWTGVGNPAATDVLMVAYDSDNGSLWFGKNGTWFDSSGTADPATNTDPRFSGLNDGTEWFALWAGYSTYSPNYTANFGQSGFEYTPPTGFVALSTANLPTPAIKDGTANFQTTLYTGNGTAIGSGGNAVSQSENSTFQPDFVWIRRRNAAVEHALTDAVRGVTKELSSNATGAEETVAEGITTFGSSGFTVGSDGSYNANTGTYAAWQWKANGSGSSNEDGSINTTATSVNTAAGISISTYTGNATSGATIGHGLGVAPDVIIVKNRDAADAWQVYHSGVASDPATDYLVLNTTAASVDNVNRWNDTAPTSSVFSLGNAVEVNTNTEDYVAYCFAGVDGFSKFGSYTGNGSADGPFIFTGFRPAFVMTKRTNSTSSWLMYDSIRDTDNETYNRLFADLTNAEVTSTAVGFDLLSNGFKLRNSNFNVNASGSTYIFMAFAEHPFGGELTPPATAQ